MLPQAQQQLNPAYDTAVGGIQSQIPQIQQLYGALVQGLQAQQQTQLQNVLASAQQRGVGGMGIQQGAQDALAGSLGQALAPLGVQNAQDVAGLQQDIGKTNVARANNVQQLADSLTSQNIAGQKNALAMKQLNQNAQLEMQKNQQNYNIQQANFQTAQARAAARASEAQTKANDITKMSESTITRQLRLGLNNVKGGDNHVSPENLAKAYVLWNQAGLDEKSFWKNFQGDWNPQQPDYSTQFHYFINNPQKIR